MVGKLRSVMLLLTTILLRFAKKYEYIIFSICCEFTLTFMMNYHLQTKLILGCDVHSSFKLKPSLKVYSLNKLNSMR